MSKLKENIEAFKENPEQWNQDSWDSMDDKKAKSYNILVKTLAGILAIMSLLLTFVYPLSILISIGCAIFIMKFDARKRRSSYKKYNK